MYTVVFRKNRVKALAHLCIHRFICVYIDSSVYTQMNKCFDSILSKCQFGFRKGYSAQQCFLNMIQKLRASLDQNGTCAALLTELSKNIDCLPHHPLILNFMLTVVTFRHRNCLTVIYVTKVLKQTIAIAHRQKFYLESHKNLS